jgi:hypothetical protein
MATFNEVFARTYAEKRAVRPRKARTPLLVVLGGVLATIAAYVVVRALRFRRVVMYVAGFGFIDYALYVWHPLVGYAGIGVSLLILEMLSGGDDE